MSVKTSKDLKIKIIAIKGKCPVYRIGHSFYIKDGYILDVKKSDDICMHSLTSILPYYVALSKGIEPVKLGLSKQQNSSIAYLQCLDPCDYTGGGTVTLQIELM